LKAIVMRGRWRRALGLAITAALFTAGGAARAADLGPTSTSQPAKTGADALGRESYWGLGSSRLFVSSTVDAGYLYFRPQIAVGYGKPHWSWIGAELYPSISGGGAVAYTGLRAALRHVDLRVGARYVLSFNRHFLAPRASFTREHVETRSGKPSRYVGLDSELAFSIPLYLGTIFGLLGAYGILGVPEGSFVFEEGLHTVMKPPFIARARLGYALALGDISLGAFGEVIVNPGRRRPVARAGPSLGLQISDHLDLFATFAFVLGSSDTLGLLSGDIGTLGVRYRWASGESVPVYMIP
jgi:hypothetical protein